jgi:hypothetical protein
VIGSICSQMSLARLWALTIINHKVNIVFKPKQMQITRRRQVNPVVFVMNNFKLKGENYLSVEFRCCITYTHCFFQAWNSHQTDFSKSVNLN